MPSEGTHNLAGKMTSFGGESSESAITTQQNNLTFLVPAKYQDTPSIR